MSRQPGQLYIGTSGFSYPRWVPRFYPPGRASRKLLTAYAARLPAVELDNTFYRRPPPETVARWLRETPEHFRFCPKAQRGTSWRVWSGGDPAESFAWLTESFRHFGERLGCVLLSAPGRLERDDDLLGRVLTAWPQGMRLALQLPHPSWTADAVRTTIEDAGAAMVLSDWDDGTEPDPRQCGAFLYLRLRRASYTTQDVERWARRIKPVVCGGRDVFAFFRHDDEGHMPLHAEALLERASRLIGS